MKTLSKLLGPLFASIAFFGAGTLSAGESTTLSSDNSKESPPPAVTTWCETPSPLEFRIGLPGFLSQLSGDFGVRGVVTDLDISIDELVRHIDAFPVALSVYARYHRWEFFADGEWIQLSASAPLRGLLFTRADLDLGYAFWEGFVGYRIVNCDKAVLSFYAGARYTYYSADFRIQNSNDPRFPLFRALLGIPQSGQASGDKSWVDPVVGISGRYRVAKAVTLYASGDVGGFNANADTAFEIVRTGAGLARVSTSSSDWSYQAQGGVEVQWARQFWTQLGWRYLKYDYQLGGFANKTGLNGPFVQAGFNF
jgi:hypothetical protein